VQGFPYIVACFESVGLLVTRLFYLQNTNKCS